MTTIGGTFIVVVKPMQFDILVLIFQRIWNNVKLIQ